MFATKAGQASLGLLFLAAACGSGSEMTIQVDHSLLEFEEGASFLVSVRAGQQTFLFSADDFVQNSGLPRTRTFDVPSSGVVAIMPEVESGGELIAHGTAEFSLRSDFEWSVFIFRRTEDPITTCLGCMGSHEIAIDPDFQSEEDEALWVTWGGRERGSDVVF